MDNDLLLIYLPSHLKKCANGERSDLQKKQQFKSNGKTFTYEEMVEAFKDGFAKVKHFVNTV